MHAHFTKGLPAVASLERLSPLVTRVLGQNPGMYTLTGSNTYLVGSGAGRILVDTGEGKDEYIPLLASAVGSGRIETILVTHWHRDHTGGLPSVLKQPYAKGAQVFKMPEPRQDRHVLPTSLSAAPIKDGDVFRTEGATLRALHTPGHTTDHICLFLEEEGALFTGDVVLGVGSTQFSDLTSYLATLRRLREEAKGRIYPAHGPVVEDGAGKIDEYIDHRLKREAGIITALEARPVATGSEIVQALYTDVPESLHKAAEINVLLHLQKLETDGAVVADRSGAPAEKVDTGSKLHTEDELHDVLKAVGRDVATKWSLKPKAASL